MTTTIYVVSTQIRSGKSALSVGLLRRFQQDAFSCGYMKPVHVALGMSGEEVIDEDARFAKTLLDLTEELELMVPVTLTEQKITGMMSGIEMDLSNRIRSAFTKVAHGKTILVAEGGGGLYTGWSAQAAAPQVAAMIDARCVVVIPYHNEIQVVDDLATSKAVLADRMIGAVINMVPQSRMELVYTTVKPFFGKQGIPVFAVLPREHALQSVSVAELAEGLGGRVICCHRGLQELVEHLVIGAMTADSALKYFRRKQNKAVITGGDRPDIQLAALETSTRCLILSGNIQPSALIVGKAEEQGIPIILTSHDTMTTIDIIDNFFETMHFRQEGKVKYFDALLRDHMDFDALYHAVGLR